MKRLIMIAAALLMAVTTTGCGSFKKAVDANTARTLGFQDGFMEMAVNDMLIINQCWIVAIKTNKGAESCGMMAVSLALTNKFLYAFMAKPETEHAAPPEEVIKAILTKGMEFGILSYGIKSVRAIVESGQLAQAQLAAQGIDAANKPPLIVEPTVIEVPAAAP